MSVSKVFRGIPESHDLQGSRSHFHGVDKESKSTHMEGGVLLGSCISESGGLPWVE